MQQVARVVWLRFAGNSAILWRNESVAEAATMDVWIRCSTMRAQFASQDPPGQDYRRDARWNTGRPRSTSIFRGLGRDDNLQLKSAIDRSCLSGLQAPGETASSTAPPILAAACAPADVARSAPLPARFLFPSRVRPIPRAPSVSPSAQAPQDPPVARWHQTSTPPGCVLAHARLALQTATLDAAVKVFVAEVVATSRPPLSRDAGHRHPCLIPDLWLDHTPTLVKNQTIFCVG